MAIPQHPDSLIQVTDWIRSRRTIKPVDMDCERPLDRELVNHLLENACWAPTHGMTEPWRFLVYAEDARKVLATTLQDLYTATTPEENYRPDKFAKLGTQPLLAPVAIAICMARDVTGKIAEIEEIEAVACAVQNLHLSASAIGLGGFWSTSPVLETKVANESLKLNANERCLGLFYLGWPKPGLAWPKSTRSPLESKVTWL
ncbi:MAG: nitroreductase [Verrucomicrobia bacterium]|nr:nitroreductase [Verrucomicrobiota bacterium]